MKHLAILAVAAVFMAATTGAEARSRHKHRAVPQVATATPMQALGDRDLCAGGPLVTAQDQLRGCTRIIGKRTSRQERAVAHYNRANAQMNLMQLASAIQDYTQALALDPSMHHAVFNRAIAYEATGAAGQALVDLNSALALVPRDADALVARGRIQLRLGRTALAGADFDRALTIEGTRVDALVGRGHTRARDRFWPAALQDYDAALARAPGNAEALYGRALVRLWSGDSQARNDDIALAETLDRGVADRLAAYGLVAAAPGQQAALASP